MQWFSYKLFSMIVAAVPFFIFIKINFFDGTYFIFQESNKNATKK